MKEIDSSSVNVLRILRVIDEIAFQTSIIALNAAVESARPGDNAALTLDAAVESSPGRSRGIDQIVAAVDQIEQLTQRSAANRQEAVGASEELAAQAQSLYAVVKRMRKLLDGKADGRFVTENSNAACELRLNPKPEWASIAALAISLRAANNAMPDAINVVRKSERR
jgi:hypothetical protein